VSKNVKRVVDRLLSAVALLGVTVVPAAYVVGTVSMQRQINALEAQVEYMTEMVVNEIRQDALADVVEELPVDVGDFEEQEEQEEPQPIIPVAEGEEELLVRLVIAESGNQPYEGQVAVAQVVCDRYVAGYGDSITDVIYAENQFATPYSKDISVYPLASEAVHAVLYEGERAFIETTLFFCNPSRSSPSALEWMRTKPYIGTIADHEFYGG
jgi:spore germination cell wall hydrolase CwlJ-like protein